MGLAPRGYLAARLGRVREELAARSVDALVVTSLSNIFYLTNFGGTSAALIVGADRLYLITDFRYMAAAESLLGGDSGAPGAELVPVPSTYDETIAATIQRSRASRVAVEATHLSIARYQWLAAALGWAAPLTAPKDTAAGSAAFVLTDAIIERLRMRKDAFELTTLRAAAARLSAVAHDVLSGVRPGVTEREFALEIDSKMRQRGFQRPAFETIVASGPNSGLPHARPGDRLLEAADLVMLDFGGVYDGYCVDLTRTVALGHAPLEWQRTYAAVAEAHAAAAAAVRPGVAASDVDRAARAALEGYGLADAFGHSTGHGLGIEVHEAPRLARRRLDPAPAPADEILDEGMVFTIEPGVYYAHRGGIRIEDDYVVTAGGCERLTNVRAALCIS
ncbi:MAG: M24 family metallopeptidase [Acidobacteria bacterium]|nr:M24 family metallopeptidase [Acidobacteriota bacterium]